MRIRAGMEAKSIVRVLRRRSMGVRMQAEVLDRGLPCDAVICRTRLGGGSTPSSWFGREAQNLPSLSGSRIFVRATSVGSLVVRTRFPRGAIDTVSASRAGTVASSFSTSADKPIVFILRQNNNGAIRQRHPTMEDTRCRRGCAECL